MVPPTLAPKPGQAAATTTTMVTAAITVRARARLPARNAVPPSHAAHRIPAAPYITTALLARP